MTCDERRDAILFWVMGELEEGQVPALREHVATGCTRCERSLAEARGLQLDLLLAPDPPEPPSGLEQRLLARVGESPPEPRRSPARWRWAAAAGLAVLLSGSLGYRLASSEAPPSGSEELEEAWSLLEEAEEELGELEAQVAELATLLEDSRGKVELLRAPDVQRMELVGTPVRPEARARMFWQFERGYYCYLHASGLMPTPGDAVYALWMENEAGEQLLVGSLRPDPSGDAEVWARLPADAGRAQRAWVTLEREPPGQRPEGETLLRSS